jgi:hypothetical protein
MFQYVTVWIFFKKLARYFPIIGIITNYKCRVLAANMYPFQCANGCTIFEKNYPLHASKFPIKTSLSTFQTCIMRERAAKKKTLYIYSINLRSNLFIINKVPQLLRGYYKTHDQILFIRLLSYSLNSLF